LIDASEDSQLEAAIRASLQETHYESAQDKAESRSDDDSDAEPFSDSEKLELLTQLARAEGRIQTLEQQVWSFNTVRRHFTFTHSDFQASNFSHLFFISYILSYIILLPKKQVLKKWHLPVVPV